MMKSLTGILYDFNCRTCQIPLTAVLTSERHYMRCPKCDTNHEIDVYLVKATVIIAPEGDLNEVKLSR